MRNTLVLSCEYQLIREKTSFHLHITLWPCSMTQSAQAHHRLPKKIHLPCPSPPRNYWVDQQFHPAKVAGSVSLMVSPWSHRSHSSTKSWWGQHNSIYAITTVVGSLGVHFLTDFTAPLGFGNNNENASPQILLSLCILAEQVEPPCSTRALNFTTGWPRLRWSEYLLGFWHKEQHDRVLS